MNWNTFRKSYAEKHGPTPVHTVSKAYHDYKKQPLSTRISQMEKYCKLKNKSSVRKSPRKMRTVVGVRTVSQKSPIKSQKSPIKSKKSPIKLRKSQLSTKPIDTSVKLVKSSKLTLKDIDVMAQNKPIFIAVLYSNNCIHCQDMMEKLGSKMKDTDNLKFIEEARLSGDTTDYFPHLLYYEQGKRKKDLNVADLYNYLGVK